MRSSHENRRVATGRGARACALSFMAATLLASAMLLCLPRAAWAEGGVAVTNFLFQARVDGTTDVPTEPNPAYLLLVEFDKNVAYARQGQDDSFIQANAEKVHLRYADGTDVEGATIKPAYAQSDRRIIYVRVDGWLKPLTTYQVVVDEGIMAANGEDVSDRSYTFEFTTNAECENGLTLYENIGIPVAIAAVLAGVVVGAVRVARSRR